MIFFKKFFLVLGRFLLSLVFLTSALKKIFSWQEMENIVVGQIVDWNTYVNSVQLKDFFTDMLPYSPIILLFFLIVELLGSLSLLLGIKAKLGALLLFLFLVPTTIFMYPFWYFQGIERHMQSIMFLKNLAILGGLLLVIVQGVTYNNGQSFPEHIYKGE